MMNGIHTKILFFFIVVCILITTGCVFSEQVAYDNSTYFVTSNDSIITLSGKYIVNNDTYWIKIDPIIGTKTSGDRFKITAQTNLPVDENVLIRFYNALPGGKGYGRYSTTGYSQVTNGDKIYNKISFRVNSDTLSGGPYIVLVSAGEKGPSNFTNLEVVPTP